MLLLLVSGFVLVIIYRYIISVVVVVVVVPVGIISMADFYVSIDVSLVAVVVVVFSSVFVSEGFCDLSILRRR